MEKSADCDDSDASISWEWEDFFGSSTDLVPTLLNMYDSLIAQTLATTTTNGETIPEEAMESDVKNSPKMAGKMCEKYQGFTRGWSLSSGNSTITTTSSTKDKKSDVEIKRPSSIDSSISSSSSETSADSSSSLAGVQNQNQSQPLKLAPCASPEAEEFSSDLQTPDSECEFHSAKSTTTNSENQIQINLNERCSNSAKNDSDQNPESNTVPNLRLTDPNLSYKDHVVIEIVETERIYVNDLREIIKGYLEYWKEHPDDYLPLNDLKELFNNIEEIYNFNSEFLKLLEGCSFDPVAVARCFEKEKEGFEVYTQYLCQYPRTMAILTELMRKEGSAKSFRERQAHLNHNLPLGSYLLKPVQRILKYHLLLQNILKDYDEGADGYETICLALSAMTNIAHHINEMKRRHEHVMRVQEIQSLLYGWMGEDLTTYGELCAEGTFRVYGAKALRHVFLFDKMLLIAKKKEDGILTYKSHIMCSNLMLIESVPGEPLSYHVIPFDNPRLQCTLQARNLEQKREWTLQLKRQILENYPSVIPSHARQLVMELGQQIYLEENISDKPVTKRMHSAPEYLERRKHDRRKSESTLKARLRRARKGDPLSPTKDEGNGFRGRNNRRTSLQESSNRDRSESRETEDSEIIGIDRKMSCSSSSSCPSSESTEKKLVKKLSGWRRKSEPAGNSALSSRHFMKEKKMNGLSEVSSLCSSGSIGEEESGIIEEMETDNSLEARENHNQVDYGHEHSELPSVSEERRESIEEIVGQLVMQNREFQRILSKQRLVHLRRALHQDQRRKIRDDDSGSENESKKSKSRYNRKSKLNEKKILHSQTHPPPPSSYNGSQFSTSSNGIGSEISDLNEENENIDDDGHINDSEMSKNVQRTLSDPGNKAALTPRRFMNGPLSHYDPLSLLWSSFRRPADNNRRNRQNQNKQRNNTGTSIGGSGVAGVKNSNIRHTHSFTCSHGKDNNNRIDSVNKEEIMKEPQLSTGDSGIFPNSFTSDSSSSSEANIPTLPAVWLKKQDEHLATPTTKSGSLPRSFQPQDQTQNSPNPELRFREDHKYGDRPFTIASDKPSPNDMSYEDMEQYMSKFNDQLHSSKKKNWKNSPSTQTLSVLNMRETDLISNGEMTPTISIESLNVHPEHKIYRSSKSSIKHILLSVTQRLTGLKQNMMAHSGKNNFARRASSSTPETPIKESKNCKNKKSLKQKLKQIVREDSDEENCISSNTSSSGFGSISSAGSSSNNLTSKIGAKLASQNSMSDSDYTLSKLLGSCHIRSGGGNPNPRPQSVLSISSTITTISSTFDDKASSIGTSESLCESNCSSKSPLSSSGKRRLCRNNGSSVSQQNKDLYLSYIDQETECESDDDCEFKFEGDDGPDSFYERSFDAIESFLENEIFPDSAIYSDIDECDRGSSLSGGNGLNSSSLISLSTHVSNWALSTLVQGGDGDSYAQSLSTKNSTMSSTASLPTPTCSSSTNSDGQNSINHPYNPQDVIAAEVTRRARNLVRSQKILEKLKHLQECSEFHRKDTLPTLPNFEGIKSIKERRHELELWKVARNNRDEESETSSQHSFTSVNTVIEMSPNNSKSSTTSINSTSSRRCSDTESSSVSSGNSPLTERATLVKNSKMARNSKSQGNLGEPLPFHSKGWVKQIVGQLEKEVVVDQEA